MLQAKILQIQLKTLLIKHVDPSVNILTAQAIQTLLSAGYQIVTLQTVHIIVPFTFTMTVTGSIILALVHTTHK